MAHDVRIATADAQIRLFGGHGLGNGVLVAATAAVVDLHDAYAFRNAVLLDVSRHAHSPPPWMTRHGHGIVLCARLDDARERQIDIGKVELLGERLGDTKYQHVAVLGFHLAALEDAQAKLLCQSGIVGFQIELAVLREHKAVDGDLARAYPLAVVLNFGPSIV